SHTTVLTVAPTLLVAVPDGMDPAHAAVLPLDGITAAYALELAGAAPRILVQGAAGAVGMLAVQLAQRSGRTVVGTASERSRDTVSDLGIPVVDYSARDWPQQVREAAGGPVDAVIDHTGSSRVREALAPDGVVVRTAFPGRQGHEHVDALAGAARTARSRSERVCSTPFLIATRRNDYRRALASLLADAASGALRTAQPDVIPLADVWDAHRAAEASPPGRKVVLALR
ncbi:MAG: zinc-binding dehydrogenase, partial [Leifsonia sp.]|nr:zinc-binding dehydrogenase [Leifsonia sp.]